MRVALTVSYDGRTFNGWQTQPDGATVQDRLQHALGEIAGRPVNVVCAGRTDAGVHALAQVVHFDAPVERPLSAWVRGVNRHLPTSVAVRSARVTRTDFHARYDAIGRQYQYLLQVAPVREPLLVGRAGWVFRPLDRAAMEVAAASLVGTHDFSSFRSSQCQAASPVRTLGAVTLSGSPSLMLITFSGNAFLHHMIRNIVGALVAIGLNRHSPDFMAWLLAARDRRLAPATFAPDGLYFCGAAYPESDEMPGFSRLDSTSLTPGREY